MMKRKIVTIFLAGALLLTTMGTAFAKAPKPIPEPGTLLLFGIGVAGLGLYKKFRK